MSGRGRPARRRPTRRKYDHGEPIRWLGLVPLAGVFAIAAALILSSYGIKPHALLVDLPVPGPGNGSGPLTPDVDRLVIAGDGSLLWNGSAISDGELHEILRQIPSRDSKPGLLFTPEAEAPYARVLEVLRIVRQHGLIDRCFRFSNISRFRHYDRPETFDDLQLAQREDCPPLPLQLD